MPYSDNDRARRASSSSASASGSDSESDNDPIVRRIPVFYTPQYLSSLTLLQYPDRPPRPHTSHPLLPPSLRPSSSTSSSKKKEAALVVKHKPRTAHLTLSVPIERHEDRWNEEVAQELAKGIADEPEEGAGKGKKRRGEDEEQRRAQEREDRRLDRIEMSSITVPDVTNYLVGVLRDGQSASYRPSQRVAAHARGHPTLLSAKGIPPKLPARSQILTYFFLCSRRRASPSARHPNLPAPSLALLPRQPRRAGPAGQA